MMATTFPSSLLRLSEPKVGPLSHILRKWVKKAKTIIPAMTEPTVIPTIAPVPRPPTMVMASGNVSDWRQSSKKSRENGCHCYMWFPSKCALVRVTGGTEEEMLMMTQVKLLQLLLCHQSVAA